MKNYYHNEYLNCEVIALETPFNREMLNGRKVLFFKKKLQSIKKIFDHFETKQQTLKQSNQSYKFPKKYDWNNIANDYLKVFQKLKK